MDDEEYARYMELFNERIAANMIAIAESEAPATDLQALATDTLATIADDADAAPVNDDANDATVADDDEEDDDEQDDGDDDRALDIHGNPMDDGEEDQAQAHQDTMAKVAQDKVKASSKMETKQGSRCIVDLDGLKAKATAWAKTLFLHNDTRTAVLTIINNITYWDQQFSSHTMVRRIRKEVEKTTLAEVLAGAAANDDPYIDNHYLKCRIIAISAMVDPDGISIPHIFYSYRSSNPEKSKKWVDLLTQIQALLHWTSNQRVRSPYIKELAQPYKRPATPNKPAPKKRKAAIKLPPALEKRIHKRADKDEPALGSPPAHTSDEDNAHTSDGDDRNTPEKHTSGEPDNDDGRSAPKNQPASAPDKKRTPLPNARPKRTRDDYDDDRPEARARNRAARQARQDARKEARKRLMEENDDEV